VHERTNIRAITVESIGGPVDLVVADLSFISLRTVAPALMGVARPGADFVLLVKPQFEAGRSRVGKGGVIRNQQVRRAVMGEVIAGLDALGLGVRDLVVSPITGADGNVEFLVHARLGDATADDYLLDRVVGHIDETPTVGQTGS
jgi:23S rRNA (cytidine1920-2'-O)/16S rRNA (cytidine1409-2'-O)-methyltransferase